MNEMIGKPVLYHWEPNANSGKPMLALEEKGVEYESVYIDMLEFDQHKPEYLAINPMGTIPAMVHEGHLLNESTAIMEYVDARFEGPPLRPENPLKRWKMRWWMKYCDQYYAPCASMVAWDMFTGPAVRNKDPEELKARIEAIPLRERRIAWTKAIYVNSARKSWPKADAASRLPRYCSNRIWSRMNGLRAKNSVSPI